LNLRAVGENAAAADASGINVARTKYLAIGFGGAMSGLAGAYIAVITAGGTWTANSVSGLGWIAVALVIFAGWNPYKAIMGSVIFGALRVCVSIFRSRLSTFPIRSTEHYRLWLLLWSSFSLPFITRRRSNNPVAVGLTTTRREIFKGEP
jgi:ABC-type uncharacterized transport system permease subunit